MEHLDVYYIAQQYFVLCFVYLNLTNTNTEIVIKQCKKKNRVKIGNFVLLKF